MYSVELTNSAEKEFDKLSKDMQMRVLNVLERIKVDPFRFIKRKEGTDNFILRVGDYRIILEIDLSKNIVYAVKIGHRKNIYKV